MNQPPTSNTPAFTSVLPKVNATQQPNGWLLRERENRGCIFSVLLGFTVLLNFFAFSAAYSFIGGQVAQSGRSLSPALIAPVIFVIVGIVLIVITVRMGLTVFTFGPSELYIDRLPLRLGESTSVRFHKKQRVNAQINMMTARLICREWVRYRVGTDTRTMTQQVWSQELPVSLATAVSPTGDIDTGWTITIPADQPPSFSSSDNALEWQLEIRAQVVRLPDINAVFLLSVLPEVAR